MAEVQSMAAFSIKVILRLGEGREGLLVPLELKP